jgi:peptide deformylase
MKGLLMSFVVCFMVSLPSVSEKAIQENTEGSVCISNEIDTVKRHNKVLADSLESMRKNRVAKGVSIHRRLKKVESQTKDL